MGDLQDRSGEGEGFLSMPPPEPPRRRLLRGCAIGCAVLMGVGILSCVGAFRYLSSPGELLNEHALLSGDSTIYLRVKLNIEDAGLQALAAKWMDFQRKQDFKGLEPGLQDLFRKLEGEPGRTLALVRQLASLQVVLVGEPGEAGRDEEWLVVVSAQNYPNLWRLLYRQGESERKAKSGGAEAYQGTTMLKLNDPNWGPGPQGMALVENHLVFGSTLAMARRGVDRVIQARKGPIPFPGPPAMREAIQALNANSDLLAGVTQDTGALERVLRRMKKPEEPFSGVEIFEQILQLPLREIFFAAADLDVQSEDKALLRFYLRCREGITLPDLRAKIDFLVTAWADSEEVVQSGVVLQHEVVEEAGGVRIRIEVNRLWDWLQRHAEGGEKPPGPGNGAGSQPSPGDAPAEGEDEL